MDTLAWVYFYTSGWSVVVILGLQRYTKLRFSGEFIGALAGYRLLPPAALGIWWIVPLLEMLAVVEILFSKVRVVGLLWRFLSSMERPSRSIYCADDSISIVVAVATALQSAGVGAAQRCSVCFRVASAYARSWTHHCYWFVSGDYRCVLLVGLRNRQPVVR